MDGINRIRENFKGIYVLIICLFQLACGDLKAPISAKIPVNNVLSIESEKQYFSKMRRTLNSSNRGMSISLLENIKTDFAFVPSTKSKEWRDISGARDYFLMGDGRSDYSPIRFVALDYDFFIAKKEVTQNLWQRVMKTNPSKNEPDEVNVGNKPVNNISWKDAQQFIKTLSTINLSGSQHWLKNTPIYIDYVLRLPTEAEWEYAARAGMFEPNPKYLEKTAWHNHRLGTAQEVALKEPNPLGLFDMLGNVFEMTADCWPTEINIKYADPLRIWLNPLGGNYQPNSRGGAWYSRVHVKSFAWRSGCNSTYYKRKHLGLRLVFAPPLSSLNQEKLSESKPSSVLINSEKRRLVKLSEQYCRDSLLITGESFEFTNVSITKEFNDHIEMEVCYTNKSDSSEQISALTFLNGKNTGKWTYKPGTTKPGNGCTKMKLGKSSIFSFNSDSILLRHHYGLGCEAMFKFPKHWTDGTDERPELGKH